MDCGGQNGEKGRCGSAGATEDELITSTGVSWLINLSCYMCRSGWTGESERQCVIWTICISFRATVQDFNCCWAEIRGCTPQLPVAITAPHGHMDVTYTWHRQSSCIYQTSKTRKSKKKKIIKKKINKNKQINLNDSEIMWTGDSCAGLKIFKL